MKVTKKNSIKSNIPKIIRLVSNRPNIPSIKYNNNIDKEFKILFGGDIYFPENYIPAYESRPEVGFNIIEHYDHDYFFEKIKLILFDADLVIANLETPLVDINNTPRPFFSSSTRYKKYGRYQHWSDINNTPMYLKKYNIANVSLANNHMLDYGIEGLYQTLESLNNYHIRFFGAGYNRKQARTPFIKKIVVGNQILKLVVFAAFEYRKGYDKDFSFYASSHKGGVNRLSFTAITKKIKKIRDYKENVFIVIFPHWGGSRNYGWKTNRQTEIGHKLIDAGADLIIGHGPHNLQQIEKYKGHWIIYSLGNFIYQAINAYDKYNAPPYSLLVKLVFLERKQIDNILIEEDSTLIKKTMRIYAIVTDNLITNFQARFVNEIEFEYIYKLLKGNKYLWKSSDNEVKLGIDKIGKYIEISLD